MQLLQQFAARNKTLLGLSAVFIAINTFAMLAIPFFVAELINRGVLRKDGGTINAVVGWMVLVLFMGTVAGIMGSYSSARFAAAFARDNRRRIIRTVEDITVDQSDAFGIASLVTRMTNDNQNAQQIVLTVLQMILPSPIMAVFSIALTLHIYPLLAIVPLMAIVVFGAATAAVLTRSLPSIQRIQQKVDQMTLVLRESFVGVRIIRAFDNSSREETRVNRAFESYADNNIRINRNFALLSPVAYCLMNLSMIVIIWVGSSLVANRTLEIGSVTAIVEYSTTTIGTLIMSALVLFQLPRGLASLRRVQNVTDTVSDIRDDRAERISGEVDDEQKLPVTLSYRHVDFRYHGAERKVLDDISFSVSSGQTLAIVGGTGAGKSSIAKTLLRLNDIESGAISIGDMDIRHMSLSTLRSRISYVPQKAFLFRGTIADNFRFANEGISAADMERVARIAQAQEFVSSRPSGFESKIAQDGSNLSGGQKQRLAIARALAKPADIYVFDDSFSALDYATDARLRKELKTYLRESITVIVAQRLATIAAADNILVLHDGRIVGQGTHDELLESNRYYRDLARTQGLLEEEQV
ncbi:ABC transporter ATP-binding protein [Bifidobacterium crudilactis]|jgi:ATP-binding cassette subfamily B protein|uniref:ABC transporter ATP-binding protein n=1 Tax=Bifidobacterium crudilactis TaxID=327277 RepID=UPI002355CFB2|nr:ABC transporter ATP-binding protein [Bifidobacterium crudilactis]MCI1218300.1 ABC transporter ATP-binding protein/permease [Bifidobacterium crudilactis]